MKSLVELQQYVYRENLPHDKDGYIDGHVMVEKAIHGKSILARGHVILMQECDESVIKSELGSIFLMYGATTDSSFQAGMNIFIKHGENADLVAGRDIIVENSVRNSRLNAGGKIISEAQKGRVIGGHIQAHDKIELAVLGSPAEIKTTVHVNSSDGIIVFKNLHPGVTLSVKNVSKALKMLQIKSGIFHKVFLEEESLFIAAITRKINGDKIEYIPADKPTRLMDK